MNRMCLVASVVLGLGLLVGCSSDPDPSRAGTLEWLRERPGVSEAMVVRESGDESGEIEIRLKDGTSDQSITTFVNDLRDHFNPIDEQFAFRLRVDNFVARVSDYGPDDTVGWEGPDLGESLDRALWLRRDGRALAYDDARGASPYEYERITASNTDLPLLALDVDAYDAEVDGDEPYGLKFVSPDGNSVISWSRELDRSALEPLIALQRLYPHTNGLSGDGDLDTVLLDPADIPPSELERLPTILKAAGVPPSITGWGPVVFDGHRQLSRLLSKPANRDTYAALAEVHGLGPSLTGYYGHPRNPLATDKTSLRQALAILRQHPGNIVQVGYSPEPGVNQPPVLSVDIRTSPEWLDAVDTAIDIPEVLAFESYPGVSPKETTISLGIRPEISNEDLQTILSVSHGLAPRGYVVVAMDYDPTPVSPNTFTYDIALKADGTVADSDGAPSQAVDDAATRAFVERVTEVWADIA